MSTQTPELEPHTTANTVKKKRLVVWLPANVIDNLKETSQKTGLPVSLLVTLAVSNISDVLKTIPHYGRPRIKKRS